MSSRRRLQQVQSAVAFLGVRQMRSEVGKDATVLDLVGFVVVGGRGEWCGDVKSRLVGSADSGEAFEDRSGELRSSGGRCRVNLIGEEGFVTDTREKKVRQIFVGLPEMTVVRGFRSGLVGMEWKGVGSVSIFLQI